MLIWEVTQNGIELATHDQLHPGFEVAGQVTSIDTHGEYAAVGSAVIQLVNLTDFALNKRILVHGRSMKSMQVLEATPSLNVRALLIRKSLMAGIYAGMYRMKS